MKECNNPAALEGVRLALEISGPRMVVFDQQWTKEEFKEELDDKKSDSCPLHKWLGLAKHHEKNGVAGPLLLWLVSEQGSVPQTIKDEAVVVTQVKQTEKWIYYECGRGLYRQPLPTCK